jgi:DNA-binding NtrC family response regulator
MTACTILTITGDEQLLRLLQAGLHDQNGGGSRMIVAATMDEASTLLTMAEPRLIVVHWNSHGSHYEELNRLLWATTILARRVPVLIIADRYRIDQATTLYRMGVTEYISRTHHRDKFGKILESYLHPASSSGPRTAAADDSIEPLKAWSAMPTSAKARVI